MNLGCACESQGLSAMSAFADAAARPFQLSNTQAAAFLLRHPVVALEIGETQTSIDTGLYDWNYTGTWLPGLIPPYGTQVQDSEFGLVTVQIGTDGEAHYAAQSPAEHYDSGGWLQQDYSSPSGNTLEQIWSDIKSALSSAGLLIVGGVALYALLSRKKAW